MAAHDIFLYIMSGV